MAKSASSQENTPNKTLAAYKIALQDRTQGAVVVKFFEEHDKDETFAVRFMKAYPKFTAFSDLLPLFSQDANKDNGLVELSVDPLIAVFRQQGQVSEELLKKIKLFYFNLFEPDIKKRGGYRISTSAASDSTLPPLLDEFKGASVELESEDASDDVKNDSSVGLAAAESHGVDVSVGNQSGTVAIDNSAGTVKSTALVAGVAASSASASASNSSQAQSQSVSGGHGAAAEAESHIIDGESQLSMSMSERM